jgi:hypothetical protein
VSNFSRRFMPLIVLLLVGTLVPFAAADDESATKPKTNPVASSDAGKPSKPVDLSPALESAALAFAGEHHPELKSLVESLKTANPEGYRRAIHDLARTQERLNKLRGVKASNRYDQELALWKLDSRIRLTAARSAMKDTEELRAELKSLVQQRQALSLKQLQEERDRTAARLARLDAEMQSAQTGQEAAVDAEVDRLLKSVKTKQPSVAASLKNAKAKKSTKGDAPAKSESP